MNDHDYWIHRLSEVVDDTLDPEERRAAEAHLASCGTCREIVADLRRVVAEAGELGEIPPDRDLWPGIEAALTSRDPDVISLPTAAKDGGAAGGRPTRRGGLILSLPQLGAAAAVLVLVSSLLTWWAGSGGTDLPGTAADSRGVVRSAASVEGAPAALTGELEALTRTLEEGGARLDPGTLRIIEKNLTVIERAIEDSRRALALDPANSFLREHLERAYERKLSYLQEAAGIVEWASS